MKNEFRSTFMQFLLYRLSSVLFVQTSYAPDEYWQSLEVAHNMAFGYGHLTWEWRHGLRSYIHPFIFFALYKFLQFMHLDTPLFLIIAPKILQALLSAVSDMYFFLLCRNFKFQEYWIKLAIFTNWFWYYCGSRTIINTFETSLTIIALYHYPWNILTEPHKKNVNYDIIWKENSKKSFKYLLLAAINCLIRPTAITIWGPMVFLQLFFLKLKYVSRFLLFCIIPALSVTLPISLLIDYLYYGKFVIPSYNFLLFNLLKGVSSHYGTHSIHWYLTQGLPVVLGVQYIPFIFGLFYLFLNELKSSKIYLKTVYLSITFILFINIAILSSVPHKEFRFLLPLMPLMLVIIIKFESDFFQNKTKCKTISTLLLIANFLIPSILFGLLHQRGPLALIGYLRNEIKSCGQNCSLLFLMPCHSTPLYSHLHVNVSTRFLQCEPPLSKDHYDESDIFFANPTKWLNTTWDDTNIPSHIAIFDNIESSVSPFLLMKGYNKATEILHTILEKKGNSRYILVYKHN